MFLHLFTTFVSGSTFVHSDGYDLWKHLKTFNDSFTKLHLESISLLSAIIRSIERNDKKLVAEQTPQTEQKNELDYLKGAYKDSSPSRTFPIPITGRISNINDYL